MIKNCLNGLVLLFFALHLSFNTALAADRCDEIYPVDPALNDPFLIARNFCKKALFLGGSQGTDQPRPEVQDDLRLDQSGSQTIADLTENEIAGILNLAREDRCAEITRPTSAPSHLCHSARLAVRGTLCSSLTPRSFPGLNDVAGEFEFQWESAIIGVCRGTELLFSEFNSSIRRAYSPADQSPGSSPTTMLDLPISLQATILLKQPDGRLPYFEASLISQKLNLPAPQMQNTAESEQLIASLRMFLKVHLPLVNSELVRFETPPVSYSGDMPLIVVDQNNTPVAFLKVYEDKERFIETLIAEKIMGSLGLEKSAHTKILGYGSIPGKNGKSRPVHLETFAPGKTLAKWIEEYSLEGNPAQRKYQFDKIQRAVEKSATAINEIHTVTRGSNSTGAKTNFHYGLVRKWIEFPERIINQNRQTSQFAIHFDFERAKTFADYLLNICQQSNEQDGLSVLTIGDPTPNNIIYDVEADQVRLIDIPALSQSMNSQFQFHSLPAWDTATFLSNLNNTLALNRVSSSDIYLLNTVFQNNVIKYNSQFNSNCEILATWVWDFLFIGIHLGQVYDTDLSMPKREAIFNFIQSKLNKLSAYLDFEEHARRSRSPAL